MGEENADAEGLSLEDNDGTPMKCKMVYGEVSQSNGQAKRIPQASIGDEQSVSECSQQNNQNTEM